VAGDAVATTGVATEVGIEVVKEAVFTDDADLVAVNDGSGVGATAVSVGDDAGISSGIVLTSMVPGGHDIVSIG
jgi:hypothetical protein